MNGTQTVNLNAAECLRDVIGFGVTNVHNICSGAVTTVPWGLSEWFAVTMVSLLAVFLAAMITMMIMIARAA